ncbi:HNH endonuclease signature motif containing protein [Streptomyces sp. NPDC056309]|uniref:HNH endonuclease signature motif containing protein n=1 Tax=Streptomyces sp. NPDC056309 TaxID=3345781 RepID=UPI0035E0870C
MDERFWRKVNAQSICWIWTGAKSGGGYGHLSRRGKFIAAHRYAWEMLVGPIPEGLDLDHLCRVRACVNPDHLEPVTRRENLRRGAGRLRPPEARDRKKECPRGHPYDAENTYIAPSDGSQKCRECSRASVRQWRAANPSQGTAPGARTHCPQGHPYDEANTVKLKSGSRRCRTCQNAHRRASRQRRSGRTS